MQCSLCGSELLGKGPGGFNSGFRNVSTCSQIHRLPYTRERSSVFSRKWCTKTVQEKGRLRSIFISTVMVLILFSWRPHNKKNVYHNHNKICMLRTFSNFTLLYICNIFFQILYNEIDLKESMLLGQLFDALLGLRNLLDPILCN